ncbi:MAG: EamA family transporter [Myxococcota bacterium]
MSIGVIYTAISAILYGTIGYFGARLSGIGFDVSDLLFWRFAFSCLLLLPAFLLSLKSLKKDDYRTIGIIILLGIIFYGYGTGLYFKSARLIGTGLGMVIFFAYPLFVVLFSWAFHKQKPSVKTMFALALIVVGSSMIAFGERGEFRVDLLGIVLAAGSGLGYACYIFSSKSIKNNLSPMVSTFWVCFGCTITFVLEAGFQQHTLIWPETSDAWMLIAGFALFGTVLPIFLFLMGIKTLPASKASIISVLEPVAVLVLGVCVLGESITGIQLIGAAIILSSALTVGHK